MSKKKNENVKVLIGIYAIEITSEFFLEMIRFFRRNPKVELQFKWKTSIAAAQVELAKDAIRGAYSHLMIIESDTYDIPDDALEKMLDYDKDVVSAYSYSRWVPYPPNVYVRPERGDAGVKMNRQSIDVEGYYNVYPNQGLIQVDYTSFQMMLIKTNVFEKLDFPWFSYLHGWRGVTDKPFCRNCEKNGIELWCDTDINVRHGEVSTNTRTMLTSVQALKEEEKKQKKGFTKNAVLTEEALKRTEENDKRIEAGKKPKNKKPKANPTGNARPVHNAGVLQRLHQPVSGVS